MLVMTSNIEETKKNIMDQFFWDSRLNVVDIKLEVNDGIVNLTGTVFDDEARRAAEEDAWRVKNVSFVNNQIMVGISDQLQRPTDREVQSRIKSMIEWNPNLSSEDINLGSTNGIVTLWGSVDSLWKKERASELSFNIKGVLGVINELVVTPTMKLEDEQIGKRIIENFERNSIDIKQVNIRVEDGSVLISGQVPDWVGYRAAEKIAKQVKGVVNVINDLKIRNG
jgi:osmotically-inducible protein OsmY